MHIQHVRGDERKQQAGVQEKIINQVDELVEYFNGVFHDDQIDIRWAARSRARLPSSKPDQFHDIQRLQQTEQNSIKPSGEAGSRTDTSVQQRRARLCPSFSSAEAWPCSDTRTLTLSSSTVV